MTKEQARQELLEVVNSELESMSRNINDYELADLIKDKSPKKAICKEIEDEMNMSRR